MVTADEVSMVTDYSVRLRSLWCHYKILFEEGELRRTLLHRIAPIFFGDLNQILIEQVILQICKLTDPETTRGRQNLTIDYIVNNADFSASLAELANVRALRDRIHLFRSMILAARNQLISHLDRNSVMAGGSLGGTSTSDWLEFWEDLDELLHILHCLFVDQNSQFHLNQVGMISDADFAVNALKYGSYFQAAMGVSGLSHALDDIAFNSEFSNASLLARDATWFQIIYRKRRQCLTLLITG